MKKSSLGFVVFLMVLVVSGCAVTPRVSNWKSPKNFTQKQVFNAALQAGSDQGMQLSASDRESGTISFRKKSGKGEMILNVTVKTGNGSVQVNTIATYSGGIAISGLHEEYIRNFHIFLFRRLGITDPSKTNVIIEEMK
jgi:hypothetical protein